MPSARRCPEYTEFHGVSWEGASDSGRLEKFDDVSGGIFAKDLLPTGPHNDVVAEPCSLAAQARYRVLEVLDLDHEAVPSPRLRLAPVGHRPRRRGRGSRDPEREIT